MGISPIVAAVASSAGDLEAVSELLAALPADCGAAFVIVQHLDSGCERLLFETLSQRTTLRVIAAQDGVVAEPRHVYVMTASTTLTMTAGRIRVTPRTGGPHHPGDILFASLAQERGESAIAVVLSGEGSDGTLGVQAIKQRSGVTFAQYPGSARFPSMPISAIETGCVRFVLRPNEIARELSRLSGYVSPANLVDQRGIRREPAIAVPGTPGRQTMSQPAIGRTSGLPPAPGSMLGFANGFPGALPGE